MSFSRQRLRPAVLTIALIASVVAPTPFAGAQNSVPDPAQTSAAVPFVGEFQVWCTERNPSDGICSNHHNGPAIDFGMAPGTPLFSTGAGVVIEADGFCSGRGSCNNGAGNIVVIEHPDGRYSRYLHMDEVSVAVGDVVRIGAPLGTSGLTGHFSSAHLHFDEHFPLGTRSELGSFLGCVDGQIIEYPAAFGVNDWADVPFGSVMVNDDFTCFPNSSTAADPVPTAVPRIFAGPLSFGVAAPVGPKSSTYQIRLDQDGLAEPIVFTLAGGAFRRFDAILGITEVQAREVINGNPQPWSAIVAYDPTQEEIRRTCDGLYASQEGLTGTEQADVLIGTQERDVINGRGGNDLICGLGGIDNISGGAGADQIFAGDGNDFVNAGAGTDLVQGDGGNDRLIGGAGNDRVRGGGGADAIFGNGGNDTLAGNGGFDELRGGRGSDTIFGGGGNDRLFGDAGRDTLQGRNGNDSLVGGAGTDSFDGGNGNDACQTGGAVNEEVLRCER